MRVIHIISGISQNSGGPSRSSQGLVAALNAAGVEAWLVSCTVGEKPWFPGVMHFRAPERPGLRELLFFLRTLFRDLRPSLIHLHGLWDVRIHLAATVARAENVAYVFSPRGMLDPWAVRQKWWKKIPAWILYQWLDLYRAAAFHATADLEAKHIRSFGFRKKIFIVPNGVGVPDRLPQKYIEKECARTALFLSRLHPGKRLMMLAEAWGRVRPDGWRMRVVGFDGYGEKARVQRRLEQLGIAQAWTFEEALDDEAKWQAYANADLFVHPSISENFGISIAEALYAGLPVIATTGTPWRELDTERCGWWIAPTSRSLESALRVAMGMGDEERRMMGKRGHDLIVRRYIWSSIGEAMAQEYRLLLES